jgi:TRAP-type mannitol/chloroaromatic compound transport system permease small subunit
MTDLASITVSDITTWLAAAAFFVGAAVNARGATTIRNDFVRYGYPSWWCWITAALEFLTVVLLLMPSTFSVGITLGALIMIAAIASVMRARSYRHVPPPAVFLILLIIAGGFHH